MATNLKNFLEYTRKDIARFARLLSEALLRVEAFRVSVFPSRRNITAGLTLIATLHDKVKHVILEHAFNVRVPQDTGELVLRIEHSKDGSVFKLYQCGENLIESASGTLKAPIPPPLTAIMLSGELGVVKEGRAVLAAAGALQELACYSEASEELISSLSMILEPVRIVKKFPAFYYTEGRPLALSLYLTLKPFVKGFTCMSLDEIGDKVRRLGLDPDKSIDEQEPEKLKNLINEAQKSVSVGGKLAEHTARNPIISPLVVASIGTKTFDLRELATALEATVDVDLESQMYAFFSGDPEIVLNSYYKLLTQICHIIEHNKPESLTVKGRLKLRWLELEDARVPISILSDIYRQHGYLKSDEVLAVKVGELLYTSKTEIARAYESLKQEELSRIKDLESPLLVLIEVGEKP
uniref:Uncharacterized protein n=1 Tax=Fervidicoccus fontis TaxID=683846 RepID=A0A7J3ZJF3_9CREN